MRYLPVSALWQNKQLLLLLLPTDDVQVQGWGTSSKSLVWAADLLISTFMM